MEGKKEYIAMDDVPRIIPKYTDPYVKHQMALHEEAILMINRKFLKKAHCFFCVDNKNNCNDCQCHLDEEIFQ